ncbi:MAG: MgtC/SapB family protein [Patescibacteria group bacterium]
MELSIAEIVVRLAVATLLTGIIGIEREIRQKPAGVRTNALIGLGSALMTLVGWCIWNIAPITTDPTRMASMVVQGVGFLGAGAIIQASGSVHGLTTAATMWVVAGIGIACGLGLFIPALATTLIVLVLLAIFGPLDARMMHSEEGEGKSFFRRLLKSEKEGKK